MQGTASISTITSDPWPEFEARLVFKARLLFEEIRYMFTYITTMDNMYIYAMYMVTDVTLGSPMPTPTVSLQVLIRR